MTTTGTVPKGTDLLKKLIDLLAEQEGVRIKYVIEERTGNDEEIQNQKRQHCMAHFADEKTTSNIGNDSSSFAGIHSNV